MMFLNPMMLAGVAGAMLPLLLHLLSRARYRNVQWGAMMFLDAADPAQLRHSRVKELLLLLLRMGMISVLAVALARPVLGPPGTVTEGPACTVIILDRSGSMGIEQNGPGRLEAAKRAALNVLANLRRGDEAAVILTPDIFAAAPMLSTDFPLIGSRLSEVRSLAGRADMAGALTSAAALLDRSHAPFKHLVVICDRQAVSWRDVNDEFARNWRHSIGTVGQPPQLTLIPIGGQEVGNVAIESVQVANPPVIRDVAAEIEVRVRNFDTIPCAGLPLTISSIAQELHQTTISLDAGASATIRCSVRFSSTGSQMLTARIGPSGLTTDDSMDAAVEVNEPIGVLIISGDERHLAAEPLRSESDFLRLALTPFSSSGHTGADLAHVRVVSADDWTELDRAHQKVVVLANVPELSPRQVRQIEQFVYGGGGLLIAPGNLARVDEYNSNLWRLGAGVLPGELEAPLPADSSGATTLLGLELSHQIFQFLQGREDPIPRVMVDRYFPVRLLEPQARVLGHYASGDPFILERPYGKGRVLLFTTSIDADWNQLPLSNVYLPLMQSSVRYLAAGMLPDRNLWPGSPIVAMIDDPTEPQAFISGPNFSNIPVDLVRVGNGYEARYTGANRSGKYELRVQTASGPRQILFAVRSPRDESDLSNLSAQNWLSLQKLLGFSIIDGEPQAISDAVTNSRQRMELWPWLIALVVALAVAEVGIGRASVAGAEAES